MPRIRICLRILLVVTVTWVGVADVGPRNKAATRSGLGLELCYAAIGDGQKDGILDVCLNVAPAIMSGGFFFSGAMTLCRGFARSPERQLSCYRVLNKSHFHQGFRSGYHACLDDTEDRTFEEQIDCIETAIEAAQDETRRETNQPFAGTLCKKVHATKPDKMICLQRIDALLERSNAVELGLDICGRASSQARQIDCYRYTFRQYRSSKSMNERLRSCNRTQEPRSPELAACLQSELEETLAIYRSHRKKRETMVQDALAAFAATP